MNATAFSSPIFVKNGAYMVQEIADLVDAIDLLEEWPEDRRNLIHETALRACYQAHGGFSPMSVARDALLALRSEPGSWKTLRPFCHGSLLPNRAAARCRCRRIRRPRRQIRPGKYPGLSGIAVRAYRTRISRQGKAPEDHSSTAIAASLKTVKAIAKRAAIHIRGKARQGKAREPRGVRTRATRKACLEVLEGQREAAAARKAFREAAEEAGILIGDDNRPPPKSMKRKR